MQTHVLHNAQLIAEFGRIGASPSRKGGPSKAVWHETACVFCLQLVAVSLQVSLQGLRSATRGEKDVALARQIAMYLANTGFGIPQTDVGNAFQRDKSTVAHACQTIEDKRDDPAFEEMLAELEAMLESSQALWCQLAESMAEHVGEGGIG